MIRHRPNSRAQPGGLFRVFLPLLAWGAPAVALGQAGALEDYEPVVPAEASGEEAPSEPSPPLSSPPSQPPGLAQPEAPLLDFCQLGRDKKSSKRFQRERLVTFRAHAPEVVHAPEPELDDEGKVLRKHRVLKHIDAGRQVDHVFASVFPMQRFYNVLAAGGLPKRLLGRAVLTPNDLASALADDPFTAYSVQCADWIAVPTIESRNARWKKIKKKRPSGSEYMAYHLDIEWTLGVAVYRRTRSGSGFKLAKRVEGSNGGMLGFAFALAEHASQADGVGALLAPQPEHVSGVPVAPCAIPLDPKRSDSAPFSLDLSADRKVRLPESCRGGKLDFATVRGYAPGQSQSRSRFCQGIDDAVSSGNKARVAVAQCAVRVSMERASLAVQKQTKYIDGWRLFAPLQPAPSYGPRELGVSVGREEGVARGDAYVVRRIRSDGGYDTVGFGRILQVGPGGTSGKSTPSHFDLRGGEVAEALRAEEHAQIGVILGLQPSTMALTSKGDLSTPIAGGAAIEGGYNLTPFIPWLDEIWSKVYFGFLGGTGGEFFFHLEVMPELVFYGPRRFNFFTGIGYSYINVSGRPGDWESRGLDKDQAKGSGGSSGMSVRTGLEYLFTPDITARLGVAYRQGFGSTDLDSSDLGRVGGAGTLSGVQFFLSSSYIF